MKNQKAKAKEENGTQNIIQHKKGKSFVKPRGALDSFTPPTQQKQNNALPNALQSNMETSLGQDFSNVGIHTNSQKAVQMSARAYTQGENVHFAPGEFNPSSSKGQNLIGHEFTHVAQQRAGVVKPTKVLQKGVAINDSQSLESEADTFGRKAARGETVSKYQSSGLGIRSSLRTAQAKSNVVQMVPLKTSGGEWDKSNYNLITPSSPAGLRGVDIEIEFNPNPSVDAELIGLTQIVTSIKKKKPYFIRNVIKDRSIEAADAQTVNGVSDEGAHIDRASTYNNPIYPVNSQPSASLDDTSVSSGWGQLGYNYTNSAGALKHKKATLIDGPTLNNSQIDSTQIFETTALATRGVQSGTYYGSVRWGWETNSGGTFKKLPFEVVSQGVPSSTFMKSAEIWNASNVATGDPTVDLPIVDVKLTTSTITGIYPPDFVGPPLSIPANTRVAIIRNATAGTDGEIRVVDGVFVGNRLTVSAADIGTLSDERS
jgi:hypothetical protein